MYNFSYFKEKDKQTILGFIDENPFAFITGSFLSGKQVATQIPVLFEERNGELYIQGHIMRNTDHHRALAENPNALVVFTGANCYVSATWYSNPHSGSTWNYMSVHAEGKVTFMTPDALKTFMRKLTLKFENNNTHSATFYDNLPEQYLTQMMAGIVGFEIKADKLENVFKLSQNKDEKSYLNIIAKLNEIGGNSALIAKELIKRKAALFADAGPCNNAADTEKTTNTYLADRLKEVLLNGKWIANTNYKEQITNTTATQAVQKTEGPNTIAALTFHINYYLNGIAKALQGGSLDIKDQYSFDMPEIKTNTDWNNLVQDFLSNAEKLVQCVEQLDEKLWNQPFVKEEYGSYQRNIEAQIEHCYYHLGQIVLIKKLLKNNLE